MSDAAAAEPSASALFFVNPPQVRSLRRHLLPELLTRAGTSGQRLRFCSLDCGAGEEPYTLAMLVDEVLRDPYGWDIEILGVDSSTGLLGQAARARYGLGAVVMVDPADVRRWFRRDGEAYVLTRHVRSRVQLRHCDITAEPLPHATGEVDLLLWRTPVTDDADLLERVVSALAPGGYLLLGPAGDPDRLPAGGSLTSQTLIPLGDSFVYRKPEQTERDRRSTLPERRTADEGAPPLGLGRERRRGPRRVLVTAAVAAGPDVTVDLTGAAPTMAPTQIAGLLRDARSALVRGEFMAAANHAAQACLLCPDDAIAWYLRGVALVNAGRDSEAVDQLRTSAECDPDDGFAHYVLGGALVRLGRPGDAAAAYQAAAQLLGRPGDERAPELGGRTLGELIRECRRLARELGVPEQQEERRRTD